MGWYYFYCTYYINDPKNISLKICLLFFDLSGWDLEISEVEAGYSSKLLNLPLGARCQLRNFEIEIQVYQFALIIVHHSLSLDYLHHFLWLV